MHPAQKSKLHNIIAANTLAGPNGARPRSGVFVFPRIRRPARPNYAKKQFQFLMLLAFLAAFHRNPKPMRTPSTCHAYAGELKITGDEHFTRWIRGKFIRSSKQKKKTLAAEKTFLAPIASRSEPNAAHSIAGKMASKSLNPIESHISCARTHCDTMSGIVIGSGSAAISLLEMIKVAIKCIIYLSHNWGSSHAADVSCTERSQVLRHQHQKTHQPISYSPACKGPPFVLPRELFISGYICTVI